MPKSASRTLAAAVALLLVPLSAFASSSALGARSLHDETKRAAHARATGHSRPVRHRRSRGGATVREATTTAGGASTAATALLLGDEAVEAQSDSLSAGEAEAPPSRPPPPGRRRGRAPLRRLSHHRQDPARGSLRQRRRPPRRAAHLGRRRVPPRPARGTRHPSPPYSWPPARPYWLAVLGTGGGTLRYRDRADGPCQAETSAQITLGSLPASWSTGTTPTRPARSPRLPHWDGRLLPVEPPEPVELTPPTEPPPPARTDSSPTARRTPPPPTPPAAPTAGFTYSPTGPVVGQAVTFNGSTSTCPDGPCAYEWSGGG